MPAHETPGPAAEAVNPIIVDELRRAPDQKSISNFLDEFLLRPPIAITAKRDFVPLLGFMIISRFGKFLSLPNFLDALFKYISHVSGLKTIEAADGNRPVVMNGHR